MEDLLSSQEVRNKLKFLRNKLQFIILYILSKFRDKGIPNELYLQKILFLFDRINDYLRDDIEFIPYLMGPYSEEASETLVNLSNLGFVEAIDSKYRISDIGNLAADIIIKKHVLPKRVLNNLDEVINFVRDLDDKELLAFIYFKWPNTAKSSEKYKDILMNRVDLAVRLYEKNKVSINMAAEIAGLTLDKFIDELKKRGVKPVISY